MRKLGGIFHRESAPKDKAAAVLPHGVTRDLFYDGPVFRHRVRRNVVYEAVDKRRSVCADAASDPGIVEGVEIAAMPGWGAHLGQNNIK